MYKISLKNDKTFFCPSGTTIFDAARNENVNLDHSCLNARCRSCVAKITSGYTKNIEEEFVLSEEEKKDNFILTCNATPTSDIALDIEDLGNITLYSKKIFPSKIDSIEMLTEDVVKITLRLPPAVKFQFNAGQYVNLIKNGITRSYSVANFSKSKLEFFIKNYNGGAMSNYWFNEAKTNDLIRVEGPLGTFFVRETNKKHLIFLGTGTGVAPIKAILDNIEENPTIVENKEVWVFNGARHSNDLFWTPKTENFKVNYVPVLSREIHSGIYKGYVQQAVVDKNIDLENAQVYACGSVKMIEDAKKLLIENNLEENQFFSDAFVQTN